MTAENEPRNNGFTLTRGNLYRVASRTLPYGVYDGDGGFTGIREKFGTLYLFTEYDWDQGFGTVVVRENLGPIPEDIDPRPGWWEGERYVANQALYDYLAEAEKRYGRGRGYGGRPGDDPGKTWKDYEL